MIEVVLSKPEHPGNVGAVARSMSNFGFSRLVILSPNCDINSDEAMNRAKHAKKILQNAKVSDKKILDKYDYVIATTGQLGTDYNIPRSPINPKQLAKMNLGKKIALLFGPEGQGLTNEEIQKCDFIVTIPSNPKYPILNLSHAVTILLYEIFSASKSKKQGDQIKPVSKKEKDHLLKLINSKLDKMEFQTPTDRQTQKIVWKKLVGKSMLTKREAYALFGFFRRV